ncbi:shikimate dehydrogenase [Paraferrimonas sedimenticola]|uniref:Shikimate dehydrogenase (NADP(+)) n=1 Tax=Paraferrimonas sedimenticola TaxID=375674 RepID=A0AA37W0A2_9GAMM|nr:shikimate dehydrogenase [Paraferrimonas sedimenticola]GLP97704.1 shikimate dehydrogenase (NADP(+)) [Paraferrimonas sedimenticola]
MDKYTVVGNPIAHSKSPLIHAMFAEQTQQAIHYDKQLAPLEGFACWLQGFVADKGKGLNVTVPFKEQAYALCDQLTAEAKAAQAVNTILIRDGQCVGHNTDGLGLVADLISQGVVLSGSRVLLLGAGGAAKGAALPILDAGVAELVIANRTYHKAEAIAAMHQGRAIVAKPLAELSGNFDVIINSTSASLQGQSIDLPDELVSRETTAYDMMYSDGATPFNQWAHKRGAKQCIDGLGMLVHQAALAFEFWRGVAPDAQAVMKRLRLG